MRAVLPAAVLLGACVEVPAALCTDTSDFDGDGWPCLSDCDDDDAARFPGAIDDCATEDVDEDCSGAPAECPALPGLVSMTESEDTWGVHGGGISATFAAGFQWTLSSIVGDDGEELVSRLIDGAPDTEQLVGVELYPPFDQWQVPSAVPTVLEAGPAYVKIGIDWTNNITGQNARGTSTFGFFPNAVIHRRERFDVVEEITATDLFLVTHWSLDSSKYSRFSSVQMQDVALTPTGTLASPHTYNGAGDDTGVLCAYDVAADRRATMAWRDTPGARGSRAILGEELPAPRLALNYDWIRASTAPIPTGAVTSITAMAFDDPDSTGAPCSSAGTLEAELRPLGFVLEEGEHTDLSDEVGYVVDEGVYEIDADDDARYIEITAVAAMPRGVMLRVLIDAPAGVTVWRDGERILAFEDYLIQPADEGVTIFIPDRIDANTVLRVAIPGGEP